MIRIPEAPRPPLSQPGDTLEGKVVAAETGISYDKEVLKIRVQTTNGPVSYTCNRRLWLLLAGRELDRIRITRLEDSPAVGNQSPAKNFSVEHLPDAVVAPSPQPVPQRTTALAW